jgi:hypothetical protein
MIDSELGFGFRKLGRGLKKVGKGAYKYSGTKLMVKGNIAFAKLSAKLALLPLILLRKAVVTLGRALCKAPPQLLALAAQQANIDPNWVPLFCEAVRINKWGFSLVKKMLPPALKLASKLAASGAFPPIVPAMAIIKRIPGVGKFAGVELGSYRSDLRNPVLKKATDTLEIFALADHLGMMDDADAQAMGLSDSDREVLQGLLNASASLGATIESEMRKLQFLALGVAAAAGFGVYLAVRNPT